MKKYFLLILILCLSQICFSSQKQSINNNWQFSLENGNWKTIDLPHTWNNEDSYSDLPYYRGTGWYKKNITIDKELLSEELYLQFDGVNAFADLYINNKFVGSHKGGYTAFRFNISKFTKEGTNEIKVKVNNELNENYTPLGGDFTIFGGIYRDVSLLIGKKIYIDMDNLSSSGVFLKSTELSETSAKVNLKTKLVNKSSDDNELYFEAKIKNRENQIVSKFKKKYILKDKAVIPIDLTFPEFENPELWSPESPYLYQVDIRLYDTKNELLDQRTETLGLRWFTMDPQKGFFLNGKHLKLIGVNRHQDYEGFANALPDAMHIKDMQLIKQMGCNFLRIAHYPQDHVILEECDRLGILTCIEVPMNNKNNVESEIYRENAILRQREMVRQNYNHPSVVIWAMMNECLLRFPGKYNSKDPYLKKMGELASVINSTLKEEDPDRLTMIVNSQLPERHLDAGTGNTPDIVAWNLYYAWYGPEIFDERLSDFISEMHEKFPGKGLMITEYGAGADPRLHSFSPTRWDFTCEYQVKVHKYFMESILKRDDVIGGAVWNFADFASDSRQDTDPKMNSKGLVSYNRTPKNAYYYYESMLNSKPIVRIASRNWKNRSGIEDEVDSNTCTQELEVFSNLDSISLIVNDKLIETKKTDEHNSATFKVPFVNGLNKLEAKNGEISDALVIDFQLVPLSLKNRYVNFNVSLGSNRYFTSRVTGENYIPEKEYQEGSWGYIGGTAIIQNGLPAVGTALNIYRSDEDPVFQSHREGIVAYQFDVDPGKYEITLLFTEPVTEKKRETLIYELNTNADTRIQSPDRVFDVNVNGITFLKNWNLFKEYGDRTAVSKKLEIETQGNIKLDFIPVKGKTILSGIKIRKII
jgi:beta-galactosidase